MEQCSDKTTPSHKLSDSSKFHGFEFQLKEDMINSPWPGLPGMGDDAHVNNVLMIDHPSVVPGVFLLLLYVADTARVIPVKSKLDTVTPLLETFPRLPISVFSWPTRPHIVWPLPPSLSHFLPFCPSSAQPHNFGAKHTPAPETLHLFLPFCLECVPPPPTFPGFTMHFLQKWHLAEETSSTILYNSP